MISRTSHLKELLSKTIEPAILVVDKKLSVQYHSPNTANYIKLPKSFTTLKQIESLNKVAFTSIAKKAIHSIRRYSDVKTIENQFLKNKNYPINLKVQKLQTEPLKDTLFSISISKCTSPKIEPLNHYFQNGANGNSKQVELLEDQLNRTLTELNLLKKENERLKSDFETTHKNLEHVKTEYNINLSEQYELNFFMTEMLKNSNVATVFLNLDLQIIKYTPLLSQLFDVENGDIGRKITDFNHVFTSNDWVALLKNAKNSDSKIELELTTKNDQYYLMIVNPAKFSHVTNNVLSVSFVNISSQVKANQAKITAEEKFRTLFESAVDGMAIIDLDKKTIVAHNKKMPQMFGITKEVYTTTNPYNFFPEFQSNGSKSKDLIKKLHTTLHQKGQASHIVEHKHKTKGNFFARLSKYLIPHPTQNYAAVVLQNVDKEIRTFEALKKSEQQLKEAEGRYRSLFESAIDGLVVFDLNKHKVVKVNDSLVKMCGFSKAEIIANAPLGVMTEFLEDGRSSKEQYFQMIELLKSKNKSSADFIHLHKKKKPFHVKVSVYKLPKPKNNLAVTVIKNIDARKKAEAKSALSLAQLKSSESLHKAFFNQSLDGHVILNLEDMMPVEVNKRLLKMLRISKTEYFANPFDLFDAENNPTHMEKMFQELRAGLEKNKTFETEFHIKSSKRKSFLVKVLLHKLSAPNQQLAYAVIKDIDKERKAEEAAKAHMKALTASESMHKTFFNQSLDAHIILSAESMAAVEVNHRTLKLLRISKIEFFNTDLYAFCDSTKNDITQAQFFEAIQASLAKNIPYEAEMYMKSSKRKSFLAKLLINQMPAPNEHLIYSVIKDIDSERKAKEAANTHLKALTESENLFRTFFENGQDGFAIGEFLPKPKPIDGNPRLCEMLGLSKKEYLSSNPNDFFSPIQPNNISVEEIHKKMTQNLSQKGIFKGEVIYVHKKNGPFYVNLTMVRLQPPHDNKVFVHAADKDKEVKALQQLTASESMFRTFFENGLDGFGIAQIFPKPKPIDVNPRMLELTGLSRKEFLNSNILDFMNPVQANNKSGKEVFDEITQSLMQKGFYKGEVLYKHKKNGSFYTNITMVRLKPPNDNRVFIQIADKDKEVKALQQLAASESLFRTFFENGQDGFGISQLYPKPMAIDANPRMCELYGLSKKEYLSSNLPDLLSPVQLNNKSGYEVFEEIFQNIVKNGYYKGEGLHLHKKNGPFYADITIVRLKPPNDNRVFVQVAYKDKEVKALQQVAKSEALFKGIFDNSLDGIVIYNMDTFEAIDCNERVLEMTNCSRNEFSKAQTKDFLPEKQPDGRDSFSTLKQYLKNVTENKSINKEWLFKRYKSNELVYARISIVKLPAPFKKLAAISIADITKTKLAEQALIEKSRAIEQTNEQLKISLKKFKDTFDNSVNYMARFNLNGQLIEHNSTVYNNLLDKNVVAKKTYVWNLPRFSKHKETQKQVKHDFALAKKGQQTKSQMPYIVSPNFSGFIELTFKPIRNEKGEIFTILAEGYDVTEQVDMLKRLKVNEQKFRAIYNNSSNFIGIFDKKGILLDHNLTVSDKLANNQTQSVGMPLWDFPWFTMHKESQREYKRAIKKASTGKRATGIVLYSTSSEFTGTMQYDVSPIFDENGKVIWILGEGKDITEITNAQKELSVQEQKFRAIFNNSSNFIGMFSIKGNLLDHNQTVNDDLSEEESQNIGMPFWNFSWFTQQKNTQRKFKLGIKSAAKGETVHGTACYNRSPELTNIMQYSLTPIFDEKGKVIWILGELNDITKMATAQKELKYKEQKFRAIFNNSSNLIGLYDTKGFIDELNQPLLKQNGETEVSIASQRVKVWNRPLLSNIKESRETFKASFNKALKGEVGRGVIQYEPLGESGILEYTLSPIFDAKNKVIRVLGEGRDITEITNNQKELLYKEQKFRAIFNNSSNLIGLYDTEGYIEELNQPLTQQIDESQFPGAFPKIKMWDIPWIANFKESQEAFKTGFKKALNGEVDKGIIQYSPVANQIGIFEYTLSPIFNENQKVIKVLGEGKDITEKIEVQKEIKASEKRFRDLFYNAENMIVRLSSEGKVIAHNRIKKGDKNYDSYKKYIGKYFWELLDVIGNEKVQNKLKQDVKRAVNGQFVSDTINYNKSKHKQVELAYSLKPIFGSKRKVEWILSESRDITEFTNAQKQVLKNEQKFRAIFNNSSNFIGLYGLDGTIEEINEPILDKVPKSKRTKINSKLKLWELPLSDPFKRVIKQTFKTALKKVLKGEIYRGTAQYALKTKDVCLEFIFSPVFDEHNKVFKVLGEARDITEQMNSKKEIEASEKRFKALFLNAENTVVRLSPDGRVIAHNKIQKENENYDEVKKYIGKYLWELSGVFKNTEAQAQLKLDIKKTAKGNFVSGTIFSKATNHVPVQLAYSFKPVFGADNKKVEWILGEARDITDFIKAQTQLLENEQKFEATFYNSENYVARLDPKGNVLEHSRIHIDNPRYDIVKQYIGKPLWEFSGIVEHSESIFKLKKDIKACATGKVISNQIKMRIYKLDNTVSESDYKTGLVVYSLKPVYDKKNKVEWILAEAKDITELDDAKNELSVSLNKYQKLFENNLVGIITLDENLKLIECNEAYEKITGYSLNDAKGFDYYNIIDEEEVQKAKLNEQKIRNSKVKSLQFKRTFIKKNGEKIFVHIYLKPIYHKNKFSSAVVTIADITELETNRKALKQSEELYKAVFDGVNDGLYVYDTKKNEIVTFNEQLLKIANVRNKSQFLKEANSLFIPYLKGKNPQKINWIRKLDGHLKYKKIAKFDFSLERANGLSLDISTSTIKLSDSLSLTAVTDITETKKAQNALSESEVKYRSLFENNVTGIALGNMFGEILQVNDALCAMFGYTEAEMLQLKHQDLSVQGGDDQSYLHFKAMVEGRSKKFSTTKEFVKKNGDTFYAIIFVSGIYDRQNNFKYNIASISDISELKHLENELKEKQIELADKVVELEKYIESNLELENFAFIASHDLKSPTQTIIDFSNLLITKAEKKLDKVELQFLKYIVEGSNRLQSTINDLLNFSLANNNSLNIEKVNLNSLLNNIIKDLNSTIVKTEATIQIEGLARYNWVDKGLYKELFLNLISNALKFKSKGKKPLVKITCNKTSAGYIFSVADNGIGISKKFQQKIFGIFKRLHVYSEFEGTGIGLALCKKVVERHEGKIWVESAKGKGATFHFTLPKHLKRLYEKV